MNVEQIIAENRERGWLGQAVIHGTHSLNKVPEYLPVFERRPFGENANTNQYLNLIVRLPLGEDQRVIPVATVSTRYALIQHHEVFNWLAEGLHAVQLYADDLQAEIMLSEYSERMKLSVHVPELDFDPGDHFPIRMLVEARNSVDRSCAFDIRLSWRRLICSNGAWQQEKDRLRKVHHLDWMNRQSVSEFLKQRVEEASGLQDQFDQWLHHSLTQAQIEKWADGIVAEVWGPHLAARVCHIMRSGYDGRVGRAKPKTPPHDYVVSSDVAVSGIHAPVNNLYHLSQVLSWLAGQRDKVEDVEAHLSDIPHLLKPLITTAQAS